jgi:hypothetical protein
MIVKNLLRYLLHKHPEYEWNWYNIVSNPNMSFLLIKKYFKKIYPFFNKLLETNANIDITFIKTFEKYIITKQNWNNLSNNPHITLETVKHFHDKPWNYTNLLDNINPITYDMLSFFEKKINNNFILYRHLLYNYSRKLPFNIIEKYIHNIDFRLNLTNINIPFELLKTYSNQYWNWHNISIYTNFTIEMLEYFSDKPLDWNAISCHSTIPLDIIEKNLNKPWNFYALSMCNPLTLNFIEKLNPNEHLRWSGISELSYITLEFFEKYYDRLNDENGLDIEDLSCNVNLSIEVVEKYSHLDWWWPSLSCNPIITLEFIEKRMDLKWDWFEIAKNPNITLEFIEKYIDKNWDWGKISKNPNITLEFIEKYIDKIDFNKLSENEFIYHNKLVKKKKRIQNFYYLKFKVSSDLNRHILLNYSK